MSHKTEFKRKFFTTSITSIRFFTHVRYLMSYKTFLFRKSLITKITFERVLTCMCSFMSHEIPSLWECFSTKLTFERLVCSFMPNMITTPCKPLSTNFTYKTTVFRDRAPVFTKIVTTWKTFVANITSERYLFPWSTGTLFNGYFQDTVKSMYCIITIVYYSTCHSKRSLNTHVINIIKIYILNG